MSLAIFSTGLYAFFHFIYDPDLYSFIYKKHITTDITTDTTTISTAIEELYVWGMKYHSLAVGLKNLQI